MAYKRDRRADAPKADYEPMAWVKTSGDVEKDALYVTGLATRKQRLHEMGRLQHFHGRLHVKQVEQRVLALWSKRADVVAAREAEAELALETCFTN